MRRNLQSKNKFFKAMVFAFVIAILPLTGEVSAAPKRGIVRSGRKKVITAKEGLKIYFGDKTLDLDLLVDGKLVKEGIKWWTKNTKTIKLDKDGNLFPLKNGKAVLAARYKGIDFKIPVEVGTKAVGIYLTEETGKKISDISLEVGEKKRFRVHYILSAKVKKAGGKVTTFSHEVFEEKTEHLKISKVKNSDSLIEIEAFTQGKSSLRLLADEDVKKLKNKKGALKYSINYEVNDDLIAVYEEGGNIRLSGKKLVKPKENYVIKKGQKEYNISEIIVENNGKELIITTAEELEEGSYTLIMGNRKTVFDVVASEDEFIDENNPNEVEEIE